MTAKIGSCPLLAGLCWRTQARPKQQTAVMRRFTTAILRFLKSQAITLRRLAIRLPLFVRLLREQSGSSTVKVCAFSRSQDFFAYRMRATGQRDTGTKSAGDWLSHVGRPTQQQR